MAIASKIRPAALALALLLALVAGGCGDDPSSETGNAVTSDGKGETPDTAVFEDVAALEDAGPADVGGAEDAGQTQDAGLPPDTGFDAGKADVPVAECPGGAGCACDGNIDCDLGVCIPTAGGKKCAAKCVDACETGYQCVPVAAGGGDAVNICAPVRDWLCDPCSESKACQKVGLETAACVDYGAKGAFCGIPCNDDTICGEGSACKEVLSIEGGKSKQCVRTPDAGEVGPGTCVCSKAAAQAKLSTQCFIEAKNEQGQVVSKCPGVRTCTLDGLSACVGPPPGAESCDGVDNDCDGETDEGTCEDDNPCTKDACDAKSGKCVHEKLADGISCDDGSACTQADACTAGDCKGTAVTCDDDNPCTANTCDPKTGCKTTNAEGAGCDDDNPCTVGDACSNGTCEPGAPKVCKSTEACLTAKCDPTTGGCKFLELDAPCDDGNLCTKADACAQGFCVGKAVDCDDKNPCTSDTCAKDKGCASVPNTSPCDDEDACTEGDVCADGKCVGLAKNASQDCDDNNVCTTDACDKAKGCTHTPTAEGCDDGNPCTVGDTCKAAKCEPGTNTCDCTVDDDCGGKEDGNLCNGTLFCDKSQAPWQCKVNPKTVVTCDASGDGPCAQSVCTAKTGKCETVLGAEGKPCDADGSLCTVGDGCKAGKCVPGEVAKCDDNNPCTTDTCEDKTGCVQAPNTAPCNADDNACTLADQCKDKVCLPGSKKVCDDANTCTADTCDPKTGKCVFDSSAMDAQACDADGSVCTVKDSCKAGTCVADKPLSCDDGNPCTDDTCDAKTGCKYAPNQAACSDGDPCTGSDTCAAGKCLPGNNICDCLTTKDCAAKEDGDLCNGTLFCDTSSAPYQCKVKEDSVVKCDTSGDTACAVSKCQEKTGACVAVPTEDGGSCSDGDACSDGDLCKAGKCLPGGPKQCDDSNPCTVDSCDKAKGCVHEVDGLTPFDCYTGKDGTAGVGECKSGKKTCKSDGSFGPCVGQVVPAGVEACDGKDNTCDGKTDTGCSPETLRVGFGGVRLDGQSGAVRVRARAMGDSVAGPGGGDGKYKTVFGLDKWLRQVLGL